METIGEKIYRLRKKSGYSQEELAFQVGVSRQTVSKWEADSMQPSLENIKTLCAVFAVSADYFLSDEKREGEDKALQTETTAKIVKTTMEIQTLKVSAILIGVLLAIGLCVTVLASFVAFSSNNGDVVVRTSSIDETTFIVFLAITLVLAALESLLSVLLYKKRKIWKVLATNCKQ